MEKKKEMLKLDENLLKGKFEKEISDISQKLKSCCSEDLNAFWHIHKHEVELPLKKEFHGKLRRSKVILMNFEQLRYCKEEIKSLLQKGLIRKSHSPIACFGFYVNKHSEIVKGKPRLVVNYKPLNNILDYDAYPFPKPSVILSQISQSKNFFKSNLNYGF